MINGVGETNTATEGTGTIQFVFSIEGFSAFAQTQEGLGTVVFDRNVVGVGETNTATEGTGSLGIVYSIQGVGEHVFFIQGNGEWGTPNGDAGGGSFSTVLTISGAGETPSVTEGTGTITYVYNIAGVGETNTVTEGTGTFVYDVSIAGNAEFNYANSYNDFFLIGPDTPSRGNINFVFGIDGSGETNTATEGTGDVGYGDILGHAEINVATEGTGTVELIPTMSALTVTNYHFTRISTNTTSTTTIDYILTAALTLTLNASPLDGEKIFAKALTTGSSLAGNGKNIDSSSTYSLAAANDSVTVVYSEEDDVWYVVATS